MTPAGVPAIVFHLARQIGGGDPQAELAAALACQATQSGHVCADLDQEAGWGPWAGEMDSRQRAGFRARLPAMPAVGGDDDWTPLVWDGRRLYLRRYRDYERRVADDLRRRAASAIPLSPRLEATLGERFADTGQRNAARIALTRRLALVSGGPGTGKTTTLARLIALLREQAGERPPRLALAAPTGKAAQRMAEALAAAGAALPDDGAMTLHRLLGMRPDGSCRHDAAHPLAVDVLVVDEASMIDLSLMAHLLAALPARARLILLGDRDQLAAVEAGAVFAELCAAPALAECVAPLTTSFRFAAGSGIGRVARALREGDAAALLDDLRGGSPDLDWQPAGSAAELLAAARAGYADYATAVAAGLPAAQLFEGFAQFRVLCAHRQEVAAINRSLCAGDASRPQPGMPLLATRNDSTLGVFNGDVGLALPDPADGQLKACFPGGAGGPAQRWIPFARLPAWEAAWAMTVHKAQGSEFARVLLALPSAVSPVTTRELVYTGITRARMQVSLWAAANVLQAAAERRAERMSGLGELLAA